MSFFELWGPEPGTVFHTWPNKRSVEWDDHTSIDANIAPSDAAQDLICLHCCSSTLLPHVHLDVSRAPSTGLFL